MANITLSLNEETIKILRSKEKMSLYIDRLIKNDVEMLTDPDMCYRQMLNMDRQITDLIERRDIMLKRAMPYILDAKLKAEEKEMQTLNLKKKADDQRKKIIATISKIPNIDKYVAEHKEPKEIIRALHGFEYEKFVKYKIAYITEEQIAQYIQNMGVKQ